MDTFDILQEEERNVNHRLVSQSTSLEQARLATNHSRTFEHWKVTKEQLKDEMTYTMMSCSPCTLKDRK